MAKRPRKTVAEILSDLEKQRDATVETTVDALLASEAMEETARYLSRGRKFSGLPDDEVRRLWTSSVKAWLMEWKPDQQQSMEDSAAELRLPWLANAR